MKSKEEDNFVVEHIYQIKVTLRGTQPPIWRRIQVWSNVTLLQLHRILQVAMGWTDSHLHQYRRGSTYYGTRDPEFGVERESERSKRLGDVLVRPRARMVYEYDFGDGWEHDVILEKIVPVAPGRRFPLVLAGRGACPPEDVGGVGGFYHFLEALENSQHPDHDDMVEWWGETFSAEFPGLDDINRALARGRKQRGGTSSRRLKPSAGGVLATD